MHRDILASVYYVNIVFACVSAKKPLCVFKVRMLVEPCCSTKYFHSAKSDRKV